MRPLSRSARSKRSAESRARLLIKARLGWLGGYPVGREDGVVLYQVVPRGEDRELFVQRIDRGALSRAVRTVNELRREFPRALPRIVGDADRWAAAVRALVASLQPAVHHGKALPTAPLEEGAFSNSALKQLRELETAHPPLRALLRAQAFLRVTEPKLLRKDLRAVAARAASFERLVRREEVTLNDALLLLWLATCDGVRADGLLDLLGSESTHRVATAGEQSSLQTLRKHAASDVRTTQPIGRPKAHGGHVLQSLLRRLARLDTKARRRSLSALDAVALGPVFDAWDAFWRRFAALEQDTGRGRPSELLERAQRRQDLMRRGERLVPPLPIEMRDLRPVFDGMAEPELRPWMTPLPGLLSAMASHPPGLRARFAMHLFYLSVQSYPEVPANRMKWLVRGLSRYLSKAGSWPQSVWLGPWRGVLGRRFRFSAWDAPAERLLSLRREADMNRALDAIAVGSGELGGLEPNLASAAAELTARTALDAEDIAARIVLLAGDRNVTLNSRWEGFESLAVAHQLGPESAEDFLDAFRFVVEQKRRHDFETMSVAADVIGKAGPTLLRLIRVDPVRLIRCAHAKGLARLAGSPKMPPLEAPTLPPRNADWAGRYPQALQGALRRLVACHPEPERAASSILKRDFPDPNRLARELRALDARKAGRPDLEKRARSLRERLEHPRPVGEVRMARHIGKLERAADEALFSDWERRWRASFMPALKARVGVAELPPWALDNTQLPVFGAVGRLKTPYRELALRLLKIRSGPPPWDLRDEPKNRAFLDELEDHGIDTKPWVEGIGPHEVTLRTPKQETLTLSLEDDPLEVFRMGEHFGTCLAFGGINFFSVIVNAADISKRVLYARDERGSVVGRCLLAITDAGHLVTFHVYAHRGADELEKSVKKFASSLATRMGTVLANAGPIRPLMAPDWYDDGIRTWMEGPGGERATRLRETLSGIEPERFLEAVSAALHPLPVNARTIPMVLEWPELREHPSLALPLIGQLGSVKRLPQATATLAATLAFRAGSDTLAKRVARTHIVPTLLQNQHDGCFHAEPMSVLVKVDPSAALRLLRQTREPGVRRWRDESILDRLMWGAKALEALHRRQQARALYEQVRGAGSRHFTKEASAAIERIDQRG